MKSTKKLLCSLFAIIAVAFMIGSAFTGIAGDINGADDDQGEANDSDYTIVGYDSSGKKYTATADSMSNALVSANEFVSKGYVNISVTMVGEHSISGEHVIPDNVDFIVGETGKLTIVNKLTVKEGSTLIIKGTVEVNGKSGAIGQEVTGTLSVGSLKCISAVDGKIIVKGNGKVLVNDKPYIGTGKITFYYVSEETQVLTLKTVGDSKSGFEFGVVLTTEKLTGNEICSIKDLTVKDKDVLNLGSLDNINFDNVSVVDSATVKVDGKTWLGKGALEGDAVLDMVAPDYVLNVTFSGAMTIAEKSKVTLDVDGIAYYVGILKVEGTLILDKAINVMSAVDVSGNLVLKDRNYLYHNGEGAVSVEVEGNGLITLGDNNKWYGNGAALDPTLFSDVKLLIVDSGDGVNMSYQFAITGVVFINYVDEYSYFDLRAKYDMIVVSAGFLTVNGFVNISGYTEGALPIKTTGIGGIAVTCAAEVWMNYGQAKAQKMFGDGGFIELAYTKPTEAQYAALEEFVGDTELFNKIKGISVGSLAIMRSNSAGGFDVNIAGVAHAYGLPIGSKDYYTVTGVLWIEDGGKDSIVDKGGKLDVIGKLIVKGGFTVTNKDALRVLGITEFTGVNVKYECGGEKIVGASTEYTYTLSDGATLVTFSNKELTRWSLVIAVVNGKDNDNNVQINKRLDLEKTIFLVGYDHVKITKEKEFLGLTEDDISALEVALGLDKVEIKEKYGRIVVANGGVINDVAGNRFLLVHGDAVFQYGGHYVSKGTHIVGMLNAETKPQFALTNGAVVIIRSNEIPEEVLEMLIKEDPNTPYRNLLLGKSYIINGPNGNGKVWLNNVRIAYNECLVYKESDIYVLGGDNPVISNFTVLGEAMTTEDWSTFELLIGSTDKAKFQLTDLSSVVSVSYNPNDTKDFAVAIVVNGHVTLNKDLLIDGYTTLQLFTAEKHLFNTVLRVNAKVEVTESRYLTLVGKGNTFRFLENSSLIYEGKNYIGMEGEAITSIHEDAFVEIKANEKGGIDIYSFGWVHVIVGKTLTIWENDTLTVTNSIDNKSFTVSGTLEVFNKDSLKLQLGTIYLRPTAKLTIGGEDIFGDENAIMSIGETAHVILVPYLDGGYFIKVVGDSKDKIGENDKVTLNEGKKLEIGSDKTYKGLALLDANFVISKKAEFTSDSRYNLAAVTTKLPSETTGTSSIIGIGADSTASESPIIKIVDHIDEETKAPVYFVNFNDSRTVGFHASEYIFISAFIVKDVEVDENSPIEEILSFFTVKNVDLVGEVKFGDQYTIKATDVFTIRDGIKGNNVSIDASVTVNGKLYLESTSITIGSEGGKSLCTGTDGIIYIKGSSKTNITWGGKMVGSDTKAPLLFGDDTLLSVQVDFKTGVSKVRFLSGSLELKEGMENTIAEGSYVTFAKVDENAETGATFNVKGKLTIEGKLTIADGGTVNFATVESLEKLDIVQDKGSLVLLENSSLITNSKKWFGTDGTLSVGSVSKDGIVTFTNDTNGLLMTVGESTHLVINDGETFTVPEFRIMMKEWSSIVIGHNATLKFDSKSKDIEFVTGYYVTFMVGAKLIDKDDNQPIGPEGTKFLTSGEAESVGNLTFSYEKNEHGDKRAVLLNNGNSKDKSWGITVELKDKFYFTQRYPLTIESKCELIINGVDSYIEGGTYGTISGKLTVLNNPGFYCDPAIYFGHGATFTLNEKPILGELGVDLTSARAKVAVSQDLTEEGERKITIDARDQTTSSSAGIDIGKKASVTINETFKLKLYGVATVKVYGELILDNRGEYLTHEDNIFRFNAGSRFATTSDGENMNWIIGDTADAKKGIISLSLPGIIGEGGDLSVEFNKEGGFDIRLNDDIIATVQKDYVVSEKDTFVVGALATLTINGNMTVNCKTLKVNGTLKVETDTLHLAEGTTVELAYNSKLISNSLLVIGGLYDENAKVRMLNDQCGEESGGILLSTIYDGKTEKGILFTVRSMISVNPGAQLELKTGDAVLLMNDVEVEGTVKLKSLDQITIAKDVKVSFLPTMSSDPDVVLGFNAELIVKGVAYISSKDTTALFYVKPDTQSLKESYTKIIAKVSPEGVQTLEIDGNVVLTKEYNVPENKSLVVDKYSTFEVKGKLTVNGGKFVTFGTVLIEKDMFDYSDGYFVIEQSASVIYDGKLIVGDSDNAWINIYDSPRSQGYISFNNKDKTMVAGGRVAVNTAMTVPEGFKLVLRDCEMDIYGSLTIENDTWQNKIEMEFNSAIGFHVGTYLVDSTGTVIGTDDDNALFSLSGVQSPTSKIFIANNSDFGRNGIFIMSGIDEYFKVTVNAEDFTLESGKTIMVGTDSKLFFTGNLVLNGTMHVHGDLVFKDEATLDIGERGSMHFIYGATLEQNGEEIIGHPHDGILRNATIEMMNGFTTIDIFGDDGDKVVMSWRGYVTINTFKTVILPENWTLYVGGMLDVNGTLIVKNPNGMEIAEFNPNYPVTTIDLGPMSTFSALINGSVNLGGFVFSKDVIGVKGNVNLSRDLVLNGMLGINGNLILNGHNIDGGSKDVYVMGAVVLDGQNSHQLDDFMGSIRAHQYYDGPMRYVAMDKVVVTWELNLSVEYIGIEESKQPHVFYTEKNKFDGFSTVYVALGEFQKATLTVVRGQAEIVQISDGVWQVYSNGFDVECKLVIEDVGPSSDYEININEIVDAYLHPGLDVELRSNNEQYIGNGELEIHYNTKTLVNGKWVYGVSGCGGLERWIKVISTEEMKVGTLSYHNVLVASKALPAGSYLVSGYATFTMQTELGVQIWSSQVISSTSDTPVPEETTTLSTILVAAVSKAY